MSEQLFTIFFIGHPSDDDYAGWLRQRLAYAGMGDLVVADGATGTWGGIPCHARHLDDDEQGPLVLSYAPDDFDAAMKSPPVNDYLLPPPLAAFVDACRSLSPNIALLASQALPDTAVDQHVTDISAELAQGTPAELLERPYTAFYLNSFEFVMLEDDLPLLAELRKVEVAGGTVFFPDTTATS
jgi:hypothetical protein